MIVVDALRNCYGIGKLKYAFGYFAHFDENSSKTRPVCRATMVAYRGRSMK